MRFFTLGIQLSFFSSAGNIIQQAKRERPKLIHAEVSLSNLSEAVKLSTMKISIFSIEIDT